MTGQAVPGRRERKKQETREALIAAARQLFAEQGFAATTVREIADAADVAERTFFRYFDSKEDLLLPDLFVRFREFEAAVRARPAAESPLTAIREAAIAVFAQPSAAVFGAVSPGIDPLDPAVAAHLARAFVESEDRLAEVLTERLAATGGQVGAASAATWPDADLWVAVTARAALATFRGAFRILRSRQAADGQPRAADFAALLRAGFAVLEAGCPAPGPRTAPEPPPGNRHRPGTSRRQNGASSHGAGEEGRA
ncbi:MAG: helix-turn-helix domain containing protein [Actinomycetota bacterium]|jgi:AcrR family transcriptional regulator|nr:helix-turn-helix domain containing protein [Actinomycetota bacterium]